MIWSDFAFPSIRPLHVAHHRLCLYAVLMSWSPVRTLRWKRQFLLFSANFAENGNFSSINCWFGRNENRRFSAIFAESSKNCRFHLKVLTDLWLIFCFGFSFQILRNWKLFCWVGIFRLSVFGVLREIGHVDRPFSSISTKMVGLNFEKFGLGAGLNSYR